jgi:hypothetical protein
VVALPYIYTKQLISKYLNRSYARLCTSLLLRNINSSKKKKKKKLPALTELCSRTLPLSLDEARQMSMEDVVLVATVREEIRGGALRVDIADISRHVEVAQAGKQNHPVGSDVYWDGRKSGSAGQESDSTMASAVDLNVEAEIAKTMGVASPSGSQHRGTKEGDTRESRLVSILRIVLEMQCE